MALAQPLMHGDQGLSRWAVAEEDVPGSRRGSRDDARRLGGVQLFLLAFPASSLHCAVAQSGGRRTAHGGLAHVSAHISSSAAAITGNSADSRSDRFLPEC